MSPAPVPTDHPALCPYLIVDDADALLAFLIAGLGGSVTRRVARPDGRVMHAQVRVADSVVMLSSSAPQHPAMPTMLHLYVPDVDAAFARAVAAGGTPIAPPTTTFYGDRTGGLTDPTGNQWWLATHVEDVTDEEIARRQSTPATSAAG